MDHNWPSDQGEHVWSSWMNRTGPPNPTQYRVCVHQDCSASETRETPKS